jgi:hypothetical protein
MKIENLKREKEALLILHLPPAVITPNDPLSSEEMTKLLRVFYFLFQVSILKKYVHLSQHFSKLLFVIPFEIFLSFLLILKKK